MHTTFSYELGQARIADLRRQAQREALARRAAHVPSSASKPDRKRIPVSLPFRLGNRRREWPPTIPAT
jgi:hypothetical protein